MIHHNGDLLTMTERMILDWCPLCGEKLPDDFRLTRLFHDRVCHPGYMLLHLGVTECEHNEKTHYLKIQAEKELPIFHLEFCDECYKTIPSDVQDENIPNSKKSGENSIG